MSAWKLVEAVVEEVRQPDSGINGFGDRRGGRGGGRGGGGGGGRGITGGRRTSFGARNGPSRGGGYHDRGHRSEEVMYELDAQMKEYYAHMAVQQIELLYGVDYLCVDTYFRSYMDEEGYVPMALLASYPNISCYAASIQDLVEKLSQKEDSILEVDVANETVRLRDGWEKWLMPNATGSRGVPKYVRQVEGTVENSNGSYFNGWWTDADSTGPVDGQPSESSSPSPDENRNESNRIRVDAGTLSASAVEFKPKVPETTPPISNGKVSYAAAAAKIASTV